MSGLTFSCARDVNLWRTQIKPFHTTLEVLFFLSHSVLLQLFCAETETFQSLPIAWKPKRRQGEGLLKGHLFNYRSPPNFGIFCSLFLVEKKTLGFLGTGPMGLSLAWMLGWVGSMTFLQKETVWQNLASQPAGY